MREGKRNKIILGTEVLLLCMIVGILRSNAVSSNPPSSEVNYNKNNQTNVQGSINDLYNKVVYGDATSSDILKGKTALVGGKQIVGTYTCPTLASQTSADATPENITEGNVAWVNGERIVGTRSSLVAKVNLGDYISYTPAGEKYSIDANGTGFKAYPYHFVPSELNLWRVIRKNEDGTIDIVSEYATTQSAKFSCRKYVGALNLIAASYETKGITVGSRHMGYDRTKVEEDLYPLKPTSDMGYETDVLLVKKAIGRLWAYAVGTSDQVAYYLASRASEYDGESCYVHIIKDGTINNDHKAADDYVWIKIRPIVVLKSTLKITGGDGTESSPYTLGT